METLGQEAHVEKLSTMMMNADEDGSVIYTLFCSSWFP
jgi:hypothetical protein